MPRVGFEPTIPAFEWAKTVHALDRAAIVIGPDSILLTLKATADSARDIIVAGICRRDPRSMMKKINIFILDYGGNLNYVSWTRLYIVTI
jgi:hypothetical protein